MKYAVVGIDIALLVAAILVWLSGRVAKKDTLKKVSYIIFGLWCLFDVILMIVAFPLGWYK